MKNLSNMWKSVLATLAMAITLSLAITVTGCAKPDAIQSAGVVAAAAADTMGAPAPVVLADQTVLDEKGAIAAEQAFTFAAKSATLAIRSGLVSDPLTIGKIDDVREKAYARLLQVRTAYRLGNASDYATAFAEFNSVLDELSALF